MGKYDFTDLILLVGTNPLPNYVVGKFFLRENKDLEKIWLVYTSQTKKYADNLEKELKVEKVNIEKRILSDESSVFKIRKDFLGILVDLKGKSVHLNYTGGTKSMSVHTYISLLESSQTEYNIKPSFSYLNARSFNLMDDSNDMPITGDLRKSFDLSLKTLIGLHGYKKEGINDLHKQTLRPVIKEIETMMSQNKFELKNINFYEYTRKKDKFGNDVLINKSGELVDNFKTFTIEQKSILSKLPDRFKVYFPDGKANKTLQDSDVEYAIAFLDGKWLELYIEFIIQEYIVQKGLLKTDTGWEIRDPTWSQARNFDGSYKIKFELDVVVLYGYQFIGISCTTASKRALCKSKGFEISHRSKQIGGDEARSILVTNLNSKESPSDLQDELETDTGGQGNILVLGNFDLKPNILAKKIEDFLKK